MKELISEDKQNAIVERLREVMKEKGVTQADFTKKFGIDRSYVSKVLTKKVLPSGYFLIQIAEMGFDVGYILSGNGKRGDSVKRIEQLEFYVDQLERLVKKEFK